MSGADDSFGVDVWYNGEPVEVAGPVFTDWDDDDETQIKISFYVKIPGGY